MPRLNSSPRDRTGFQYVPQLQNDIQMATFQRSLFKNASINSMPTQTGSGLSLGGQGHCGRHCRCKQCGAGVLDLIKNAVAYANPYVAKAKAVVGAVKTAHKLYTGETGTMIRNMLPNSDDNGRPGFVGETHAILKLANGKMGTANFMGPGTKVVARLKRGDKPRTASDRVAMAHDIRYNLAGSQKDVVTADERMVAKLKDILAKRQDNAFNVNMGLRPIQAKLMAERTGLVKPGTFASFGDKDASAADRALMSGKLAELEQEGYGMLPGERLKRKLMRKHGKCGSSMGGEGIDLHALLPKISGFLIQHILPLLLKKLGGGSLKLAGQGKKELRSRLYMAMLKRKNDGANRNGRFELGTDAKNIRGRGYKEIFGKVTPYAKEAARVLMPIVMHHARHRYSKKSHLHAHKHMRRFLTKAMAHYIAHRGNQKSMAGGGFWSSFADGFMSVMKPALSLVPLLL